MYNPEREWLNQAIESVMSQSYEDFELVVVNDGSEKNLEFYIDDELFERDNLRTFYQENKGFTGATNRAVEEAEGEYIAPIGDDDFWYEDKLEKQVKKIEMEDGDLVFNRIEAVDENGDLVKHKGKFPETERAKKLLTKGCYPGYESLIIRADIFKDLKLNMKYGIASDLDLWMRTFPHYKALYIDEALTKKRLHEENISKNHYGTLKEVESVYREHIDNFEFSKIQKKKIFCDLYRRKGKGLYQDEKKAWKARECFLKSLKLYPDPKSLLLFALSINPALYEKANKIYGK